MDKEELVKRLDNIKYGGYSWSLYFFKIDQRKDKPYAAYKMRFEKSDYLIRYAEELSNAIINNQLDRIDEVKEYTGENTKISCDRIETSNELVKEKWNCFVDGIAGASTGPVNGKYNGYVLEGTSNKSKSIAFIKMANPIINLKKKGQRC